MPLWVMGLGIDAMTWIAYRVASIPGAILPVRATPDLSFQAMVVGGLWLALWSTRWRLLGVAAIAMGLALTPFKLLPDMIVGREGRLVVVRGADGLLSGLKSKGTAFEMRRILEHDGDGRAVTKVQEGTAFRCDSLGCTATVKGETVAVVRHAAALVDDCASASIVTVETPRPKSCKPRQLLIDRYAALDQGTHVIHILTDGLSVTTVETVRGDRPWSMAWRRTARLRRAALKFDPNSRVSSFAAPFDLGGTSDRCRRSRTRVTLSLC
jgi:competence protein ComEC